MQSVYIKRPSNHLHTENVVYNFLPGELYFSMNTPVSPSRKVLLLGWNLASWQLINPLLDQGKLPHLQSLVDQGIMGGLKTQRPLLEHVVYNSVATGTYADKHGVLGPLEVGPQDQIQPTGSLTRRVDAIWDTLSDKGLNCHVVNFPTTGPAEKINGTFVAPSFFETVPLTYQEKFEVPLVSVHPESQLESLSQFIVTLQDIDADVMSTFVPRFRELDVSDPKLINIGIAAAQTFSVHATATHLMEDVPWDFMAVSYDLIELLGRRFFQYHVPPSQGASGSEQENRYRIAVHLFSEVVNAAIQLCDTLLGRLLELAGDDASIILYSPWGILNQTDFSAIEEAENSRYLESIYRGEGIFLMREKKMPSDELLHEIGYLDICPTVLRSCGLDLGNNLDGCAVQDYAEHNVALRKQVDPILGEATEGKMDLNTEMRSAQFASFTEPFLHKPARHVEKENLWTLAAVQLASDRREEALPLLLRLYHANPLETQRGYMVAEALYRTGYLKEAVALMQPLSSVYANNAVGQFMAGFVALNHGSLDRAKEMFEAAEANNPPFPILFYYLGQVYLLLDLPERAQKAFSRFLELDPCLPLAYLGLSESFLRCKQFEEAAEAALDAVGANFAEPAMHLALGRAMAQLGEKERAIEAYQTAIRLNPDHKLAHNHMEWIEQYSNEAIRDSTKHTWRSLTPPLHPQLGGTPGRAGKIQDALEEINKCRNTFLDELEATESQFNQYFSTAKQIESSHDNDLKQYLVINSLKEATDSGWVIRAAEPLDQAAIFNMSFASPFTDVAEKEIFVAHPVGTRKIAGAVMVQWSMSQPNDLRFRFSLGVDSNENANSPSIEKIQIWLLRAALARAVAGGAEKIKFTFRSEQQSFPLHDYLLAFGFKEFKAQDIYQINSERTRDIGLGLLDRYRERKKVPSDIRLTSLEETPFEDADSFLRQWFADGAGDSPGEFHLPECPVLLKDDQIIACAVGYIKDATTFVVTRIAVLPEYRKGWATPWLLGGASKVSANFGRPTLEFVIDESQYADWVKIAQRHFRAERTDKMRTMILDLKNLQQ